MASVHGDGDYNGGTPPATTPRAGMLNLEESFADTGAAQGRSEEQDFHGERQSGGWNDTDKFGRRIPYAGDPCVVLGDSFAGSLHARKRTSWRIALMIFRDLNLALLRTCWQCTLVLFC